MKKCIVISDSFKGSLPSRDICAIARERIPLFFPACEVRALNMADGGEGTVDCFLASCGGERVLVSGVQNPYGEPIDAAYGLLPDGTAVVEMAAAAGLPLVAGRKNPCVTTTYGVGQLIADALARGARRIVLGLGGSATNDGGCGCAAALGVRFTDAGGRSFVPVGATLDRIAHIDASAAHERLHGVRVIAMCDITNPMHGHSGAAHIFAPQKGADEAAVGELDRQLRALDETFRRELNASVAMLPGAGAAGAFGAGCVALLGAELRRGIEVVLDVVGFDALLADADLVIPGVGRIDAQSTHGKVVGGVARRAHARGVPVFAIVGDVGDDAYGAYDVGVSAIFSINRLAVPRDEAKARSHIDYTHTLDDLLRCIRAAEQIKRYRRTPAMRIAVPVSNDRTAETLSGIEGFQFFEDDHGRIVRRFFVPRAGEGAAAAVAQLEPYGVDALVCGALPGDERLETAAAGILLFPTFSGTPEDAALAFLGGTVARDPNNKCNACGFQSSCSLSGKGGCGRD